MTPEEFFGAAVRKRRIGTRIACGVLLVVGGGGLAWGLGDPSPDRAMARMIALCGIALVVLPIVFGLSFLPHKGLRALANPSQIVWFYGVGRGGATTDLMIGTDGGKLHKLPLSHPKHAAQAKAHMRALAPGATEGFSEALRLRFKSDARSLRPSAPS